MSTSSSIVISPEQYGSLPVRDLLVAASKGHIGIDQRLIRALIADPERTVPDLVKFGLEDRPDDPVSLEEDLIAIFRHLKTEAALPYYLELIRRYDGEMEDDLLHALREVGAPAIGPLVDLYREMGEEDGSEIPFALASLGVRDDRILKVLAEHVEYDAIDGAICLGLYGDPAGKAALEKLLAELDETDSTLAGMRREVLDAIEQIDSPPAAATGPDNDDEDETPFDLWEGYPETAGPAFFALSDTERLTFLSSENRQYRLEAAESFYNETLSDPVRERLFRVAREDSEPEVRGAAWESLAGEVEGSSEIRRAMLARLRDPAVPAVERAGALVGMSSEAGGREIRPLTLALYEDPATRAKALQAMWRSFDRTFADHFPPNLGHEDVEVRRHAIWGCGYLNVVSALAKLRGFFEDEELRPDALFAYALCAPGETSPARMRALMGKIDREANGLMQAEIELVETALDQRLMMHGLEPIFHSEEDDEEGGDGHGHGGHHHHHHDAAAEAPASGAQSAPAGRNDPCPCGSGKKYKKCHGAPS